MKKAILILAATSLGLTGFAQNTNVVSARVALQENNLDEAREDIDKAVLDPETKGSPKAWDTRAQVYIAMQQVPKYKDLKPYREAAKSCMKVIELKPDYDKETITTDLYACVNYYFNDAVNAYNNKKLDSASELMKAVVDIHNIDGGKRYAGNKVFDTIAGQAMQVRANCAFDNNQQDVALPMLLTLKDNPITRNIGVYSMLIDIYEKQNKDAETIAIIQEARKAFPDDPNLRTTEINYYIKSGKEDELTKKLEDAVGKDPNNADLHYNLGVQYYGLAFPKDKPANKDYIAKSEAEYQKAIQLAPDNAGYNYNLAALYVNQAADVNTQVNAITGTSPAEEKKYNELKGVRNDLQNKAVPYLEKAVSIYEPNAKTLKKDDHSFYVGSLVALKEIYASQNKLDKVADVKKKLDALLAK